MSTHVKILCIIGDKPQVVNKFGNVMYCHRLQRCIYMSKS